MMFNEYGVLAFVGNVKLPIKNVDYRVLTFSKSILIKKELMHTMIARYDTICIPMCISMAIDLQ